MECQLCLSLTEVLNIVLNIEGSCDGKYKDTIYYQGSYELDFLEKYYDKFPDIQRGPSIKYEYKGKKKVYHSDFYIPSKNLIIECKNNYLYKRDLEIILHKKETTINSGFNWVLVLDKNYNKLEYELRSIN